MMRRKTNIILMGFMGTGKSTVGRLVAKRLGKVFVDMDDVIEARAGKAISVIFEQQGEPHFRNLERALVQELAVQSDLVIATGGGVVLDARNMDDFSAGGIPICLLASPKVILQRVGAEIHRPLLEGDDKAEKILAILASRRALYESIPQQVDTTKLSAEQVADRVVEIFEEVSI